MSVKDVKHNFLPDGTFNSLEVLNTEVLQWLEKTGNGKIHGTTRLVPAEEFEIEQKYLLPYYGEPIFPKDEPKEYHVRKDNTVRYRTNYYSVPSGTYKNRNTVVWLLENNGHIELYDKESGKLICRHQLCPGKGKNVCDKRHHKDKTRSVNDLQVRIRKRTEDDPTVILWLRNLEREKPRYYGTIETAASCDIRIRQRNSDSGPAGAAVWKKTYTTAFPCRKYPAQSTGVRTI